LSQRTDKLVRRSLQKKKGGFNSVEEEWLWGRQQLLGEIPTHPMKGTGLGKKKEDDEADTRPVGKTERETRGSVYPVWDGEGCVRAGRLSPDGD